MVQLVKHPLISCKLSIMRDKNTKDLFFRNCLDEIASMMACEAFKDLETVICGEIETPTGSVIPRIKMKKELVLAPVLRAGVGMVEGVRRMVPFAKVGYIGMYRDEKTLQPVEYFFKLPDDKEATVVIIDPMLATGGSLCAAIDAVRKHGYKDIRCICLIAAPEGKKLLEEKYPEIDVFVASIDERLNKKGYILPGLGDAGDRIFGTK